MGSVPAVIRINGTPITDDDARTIIDLLLRGGENADDLSAATAIDQALAEHADAVDLSSAGTTAILGILDDPPPELVQLREILARDHGDRA
jgi:hypothetical protein